MACFSSSCPTDANPIGKGTTCPQGLFVLGFFSSLPPEKSDSSRNHADIRGGRACVPSVSIAHRDYRDREGASGTVLYTAGDRDQEHGMAPHGAHQRRKRQKLNQSNQNDVTYIVCTPTGPYPAPATLSTPLPLRNTSAPSRGQPASPRHTTRLTSRHHQLYYYSRNASTLANLFLGTHVLTFLTTKIRSSTEKKIRQHIC